MSNRGFYLQYVALLMILVAFMVGAYARRHEAPMASPSEGSKGSQLGEAEALPFEGADSPDGEAPTGSELQLASQLTIRDLFAPNIRGDERLREEQLYGLVEVLRFHDLRANLHVFAPTSAETLGDRSLSFEDDFDRALRRGQQLATALIAQGLPPEAFAILVAPARNPQQVRVTFASLGNFDG